VEPRVELRVDSERVAAWTSTTVSWSGSAKSWDWVACFNDERKKRLEYKWCSKCSNSRWRFQVQAPARLALAYYANGGFLSDGTLQRRVCFDVINPITLFTCDPNLFEWTEPLLRKLHHDPQQHDATTLTVRWSLSAPVGPSYRVLIHPAGSAVTLQDAEMIGPSAGLDADSVAAFLVPRVRGSFRAVVRGSSSAESELASATFEVTYDRALVDATHVQVRMSENRAEGEARAAMGAPHQRVWVEWSFPLFQPGDALCLVSGIAIAGEGKQSPALLRSDVLSVTPLGPDARSVSIRLPSEAGAYSLHLCASYRGGGVMLPVASSHLFVSPLITPQSSDSEAPLKAAIATLQLPPLPPPPEIVTSRPQCIICMSAEVDTMVEPCCHAQFCASCIARALRASSGTCPVCRERTTGTKHIYLPA